MFVIMMFAYLQPEPCGFEAQNLRDKTKITFYSLLTAATYFFDLLILLTAATYSLLKSSPQGVNPSFVLLILPLFVQM